MADIKIVTYQSSEAVSPQMKWIGYIQKAGIYMNIRFNGETEKEVEKKAKFWYNNQTKPKFFQQETTEEDFAKWQEEQPKPEPKKIFPSQVRVVSQNQGSGRGHGNAGRIWVINKKTRDRKRIQESEMPEYAAQGYIRGKKL